MGVGQVRAVQGIKSTGRGEVRVKLGDFLGRDGAVLKIFGARAGQGSHFPGVGAGRASLVFMRDKNYPFPLSPLN